MTTDKRRKFMHAVLRSLKDGAAMHTACEQASINIVTFWKWRKKKKRLAEIVEAIYESRIQNVEDALYRNALTGNVTAQIFFLKNRSDKWQDTPMIEERHLHINTYVQLVKSIQKENEQARTEISSKSRTGGSPLVD